MFTIILAMFVSVRKSLESNDIAELVEYQSSGFSLSYQKQDMLNNFKYMYFTFRDSLSAIRF